MIRYSLRQLEYLVTCIDCGSLAAAAQKLNVSQPSISTAIAKLEAELGVQLLLRHHAQGVSATASAERLVQTARNLLSQANDLQRSAEMSGDEIAGELRLGSFITLAPVFLPGLMADLKLRHPGIRVALGEGTQDQLIDGLRNGHHEMLLLYNIDLPGDLEIIELSEAVPYVLLPKTHPLTAKDEIHLKELEGESLILLDVEPSRDYFTGLLNSAGIKPEIAFSSPSLELVRGLVGRGLGYSLLVTRPFGDMTYDGQELSVHKVADKVVSSPIVLASLKSLQQTRVMRVFEELAKLHFIPE